MRRFVLGVVCGGIFGGSLAANAFAQVGDAQPAEGSEAAAPAAQPEEGVDQALVEAEVRELSTRWIGRVEGGDLQRAAAFWIGQEVSLDLLAETFPGLSGQVDSVRGRLNAAFGDAIEMMNAEGRRRTADWDSVLATAREESIARLAASPLDRGLASNFLAEVAARVGGRSQAPFREMSLAFTPAYIEDPTLEMLDGYWLESGVSVPTIPGALVVFKRPMSWQAQPLPENAGRALLKSHGGAGDIVMVISVSPLPETSPVLTEELLAFFVDPQFIAENTPGETKLLDRGRAVILGGPAVWSLHSALDTSSEEPLRTVSLSTHAGIEGNYINIQFTAGVRASTLEELPSEAALAALLKRYEPMFELMLTGLRTQGITPSGGGAIVPGEEGSPVGGESGG